MEIRNAKCCGTCKHGHYSTSTLSSWCEKHKQGDDYLETNICDDYEW